MPRRMQGGGRPLPSRADKRAPANAPRPRPQVHEALVERGAYPSPLNYYNFPKSVCTSINEARGDARRAAALRCWC